MSQKTIDLSAPDNRYFSGFRDVDGKVYGPRLVETEVAFATYGVVIPQVCGLSRLSGNIIWSKPLEERIEERNGIFYSNYSATFAVSFGYPVNLDATGTDLIRVWLNGRLVLDTRKASRGIVDGFNYTWYDGTQDTADAVIIAEEGVDNTPAFKEQMYLVVENLDVSTFENKVPYVVVEIGDIEAINASNTTLTTTADSSNVPETSAINWLQERLYVVNTDGQNSIKTFDVSGDSASLLGEVDSTIRGGFQTVYIPEFNWLLGHSEDDEIAASLPLYAFNPATGGVVKTLSTIQQSFQMSFTWCDTVGGRYYYVMNFGGFDALEVMQISPSQDSTMVDNTNVNLWSGGIGNDDLLCMCPGPKDATTCSFFIATTDEVHKITITPSLIADGNVDGLDIEQVYIAYDGVETNPEVRALQYDAINNELIIFYDTDGDNEVRKVSLATLTNVWRIDSIDALPDNERLWQHEIQTGKLAYAGGSGTLIEIDLRRGTFINWGTDTALYRPLGSFSSGTKGHVYAFGTSNRKLTKALYREVTNSTISLGDIIRFYGVKAGFQDADIDIDASVTENVIGFRLDEQQTLNDIIEPVRALFGVEIIESGDKLVVKSKATSFTSADFTVTEDDLLPDGRGGKSFMIRREEEGYLPRQVSFTYIDSSLNYEWTTQTVSRPRTSNTSTNLSDNSKDWKLPVIMVSNQAKYAAYRALMNPWSARKSYSFRLGREYMNLEPGDILSVTFNGVTHLVQAVTVTIDKKSFELSVEGQDFQEYETFTATSFPGTAYEQVITNTDLYKGVPLFFETPYPIWEGDDQNPLLTSPAPWVYYFVAPKAITDTFDLNAQAQYSVGYDASGPNQTFFPLPGEFNIAVPWGKLAAPLKSPRSVSAVDRDNTLTIELAGGDGDLFADATFDEVATGANRLVVMTWDACEVLGFETVVQNLDGTYTFSGLHRGKAGTDIYCLTGNRNTGVDDPDQGEAVSSNTARLRLYSSSPKRFANNRVRERLEPLSNLWGTGAVVALLSNNWTKVLRVPPEQADGKEFNFRVTTDFVTSQNAAIYSRPVFGTSLAAGRAQNIRAERNADGDITVKWSRTARNFAEWTDSGDGNPSFPDKFYKDKWLIMMYRKSGGFNTKDPAGTGHISNTLFAVYEPTIPTIDDLEYTFTQAEIAAAMINSTWSQPISWSGDPAAGGSPTTGTEEIVAIDGNMNPITPVPSTLQPSRGGTIVHSVIDTQAEPEQFGILSNMADGEAKNLMAFSDVEIVVRQYSEIPELVGDPDDMSSITIGWADSYGTRSARYTVDNIIQWKSLQDGTAVLVDPVRLDETRDSLYKLRFGFAVKEPIKIKDI
jgi:hypothetical protein